MKEEFQNDLVSIIVPIYNVEAYLDDCISSLVNQTYQNLEILLINDGSTDGSLKKCEEWAEKDERICVFSKSNEGLGPTRNYGVKHASGEWIAFIDADDWYELTFVEKLYAEACKENSNMVRCNFQIVDVTGRAQKKTNYFTALGIGRESQCVLAETAGNVCTILVKRKIFKEYYLEQPNCKSQDFAVGLAICLASGTCAYVDEALWNYRKGRPGSLTTGSAPKRNETAMKALPWLTYILKKNNLYEKNVKLISRYVQMAMSSIMFGGWMNMDTPDYNGLKELYCDSMRKEIDYEHQEIATFGSWNLTDAMRKTTYLQDMEYAFHFSSMISAMSRCNADIAISHKSLYRNKMIRCDITSDIWKVIDRKKPDWFVFDLLEERNHILKIGDEFITESDAFKECGIRLDEAEIIESGSAEWFELWKQSCDAFMTKIQDDISLDKMIMVRNYLAEAYGTVYEQIVYDEIQSIRQANEVIRICYDYIEEHYPMIKVIDVSDEEYYITDIKYEYGTYPWYLNTIINEKVAECVESIIHDVK